MSENKLIKTEKEAIECLKKNKPTSGFYALQEAVDMAICSLEEIQQYRKLGTIEELRVAKDKQEEKQVSFHGDGYYNGNLVYDEYECPSCGKKYELDFEEHNFCPNCGQHMSLECSG
ncbi:MAG: hypothetical protein E7263_06050 [Lachnospiraceae bacterium]|nr:hypothetical protein [Lachnospiraceae bacterium]